MLFKLRLCILFICVYVFLPCWVLVAAYWLLSRCRVRLPVAVVLLHRGSPCCGGSSCCGGSPCVEAPLAVEAPLVWRLLLCGGSPCCGGSSCVEAPLVWRLPLLRRLLLCGGSSCVEAPLVWRLLLHRGSPCCGGSPCVEAPLVWRLLLLWSQPLGALASVAVLHRLSYPMACGVFPDQGSNPCPLHWQADS